MRRYVVLQRVSPDVHQTVHMTLPSCPVIGLSKSKRSDELFIKPVRSDYLLARGRSDDKYAFLWALISRRN